jgi:hypothetical protein
MILQYLTVFGAAASAVVLSMLYFRRFQVTRPPIGVFNLRDVVILLGAIGVVPYLYLVLPQVVVATLLGLTTLGILAFTWLPVVGRTAVVVCGALVVVALDIALALGQGTSSHAFLVVNDLVLVAIAVGVANLWAQSGMKARDAAALGGALAVYDFIATSQLTLMTDLITRLSDLPLLPVVAWRTGDAGLAIGLGDLLLAGVFPLVMRKAFGQAAARAALVIGVTLIGVILALIQLRVIDFSVPVMVVLGPLMVVQYRFWSGRHGRERTTFEYLKAEPLPVMAGT